MTFEARDSAAKVVPARFKLSTNTRGNGSRINAAMRSSGIVHFNAMYYILWNKVAFKIYVYKVC